MHGKPFRACLMSRQVCTQHRLGGGSDGLEILDYLDTTGLAAATRVHLRLDYP